MSMLGSFLPVLVVLLAIGLAPVVVFWRQHMVNEIHFVQQDLTGKVAVVTGGTEGIGKETAKVLASWGADIILPVRNKAKGDKVREEILKGAKVGAKVTVYGDFDLADFASVRAFASKIEAQPIDILINNAGLTKVGVDATKDGIETVYQVNHLSPFLLTHSLIPNLRKAKSEARVVFVSSSLHYLGSVGKEKYSVEAKGLGVTFALARYDDTKLMNVMAAMSFAERLGKDDKITFTSLNPGFVVSNLDQDLPKPVAAVMIRIRKLLGRDTRAGAITSVTLATHPALKGVTGKFFSDGCINDLCNTSCFYCDSVNPPGAIVAKEANDRQARDWLWDTSMKLTGLEK